MYKNLISIMVLIVMTGLLLAACGGSGSVESESTSASNAAMVDGVRVDFRENHYYAIVDGFYPDSCTQINDVQQEVNGNAFEFRLSTGKPDDLMCAQMLTQYEVALLLETGGLLPGEYSVDVNERSTNFILGEQ
jgi:inhibitor of cysteine peptidase